MRRVLVLGAGFGGIAAAVSLRQRLDPSDEVVLVDRRPTFVMGLRKNWALLDANALADGERPLSLLGDRGILLVGGSVDRIDPAERAAEVDGRRWEGDALIVALGAERDPDKVPGFRDHAIDVYDRDQIEAGRAAIERFGGGNLAVGIFGTPYPCPPAPFELALLLNEWFRARGIPAHVEVFSPLPLSLPILGQVGCGSFESRLEAAGIAFYRSHQATTIEEGRVVFAEGTGRFDLLLGVPGHRVPRVAVECGLAAEGGWIKVNPRTLETSHPSVYAIGDVTAIPLSSGQMLPKAGAFAQAEGEVVAARIGAVFAGVEPSATFAGDGACFLETGGEMAAMVRGGFLADPPAVEMTEPSREYFAAKRSFERERLEAWFGR